MRAVVGIGGRQYIVKEGDEFQVEKLKMEERKDIPVENVFLLWDEDNIFVGRPVLENAKVTVHLLAQEKGPKKVILKYKRRKTYKRKIGHRQKYSRIKVEKIEMK